MSGCLLAGGLASLAAVVTTTDGRQHHGTLALVRDGLCLNAGQSNALTIGWAHVEHALCGAAAAQEAGLGPLRGGWAARDVGDVAVAGRASQSNDTFILRVAAAREEGKADAFHFVYQRASGYVALTARLSGFTGPDRLARASLAVRESLEAGGPYALVGVNGSGQLCFQARPEWGQKARTHNLATVSLPRWLRLVRQGRQVTAWHSANGRDWTVAAATNTLLGQACYAGLVLSSHGAFEIAQVRFDRVQLTVNGLRGDYFADERFGRLTLARVDPKLEFWWGHGPPAEGLPADRYSVRWTGQLEPLFSEDYSFALEAEGTARLWLDGQPVALPARQQKSREPPPTFRLAAGRRYPVKVEYEKTEGAGSLRLLWSSRSQKREPISADQLFCLAEGLTGSAAASPEPPSALGLAKGVLLRHGSFVAGQIQAVDERTVTLAFRGQQPLAMPTARAAVLFFQVPKRRPIPEPGRRGVLLSNGDFFEGEFQRVEANRAQVSSVLFGVRTFWLNDVAAIYLDAVAPEPAAFAVSTVEGSTLRARALAGAGGELVVEEPLLGPLRLPAASLVEVRRLGR